MKYFLFLNHPKGEEVYKVSEERENLLKEHFKRVDVIMTEVEVRGERYRALVDYSAFSNLGNFDCFNCQDPCCADNPTIYEKHTREFVLDNLKEYNGLTRNVDILLELGHELEDVITSIENDFGMVPDENVEEEVSLCTCSYKPNNKSTLCSLHSLCLNKALDVKDIVDIKPLVCSLWPIDIVIDEKEELLYITVPDDFTTGFTIEDYYDTVCVNRELSQSASFRRKNPDGFEFKDYKPLIINYGETLKYSLGEKFYNDVKKILLEKELVFIDEFEEKEEQILKKINIE
ncbi:hypothetical protein [uncultured Cetobacterium sp.]|uniref:hypothetical protein n=1 Tax=uncultured Cetobacterium sp. TaxID=527638 RepID=UPI00260BDFC7|nr:hypothetical protein [uncultured Cetobacterium sp.]